MKLINAVKGIIQDWQELGKVLPESIDKLRKAMIKAEKEEKVALARAVVASFGKQPDTLIAPGWKLDNEGWHYRKLKSSDEWEKGLAFFKKRQGAGFVTASRVYARDAKGSKRFDKAVR